MKHLFILNPKSFWHKWKLEQVLAQIRDFFGAAGSGDYTIHISRFPRDAVGYIKHAAAELPEGTTLRIYAVGGDGILFDCLNGMMGLPNVELGAMPYGHANNFIRGFGELFKEMFYDLEQQVTAPVIPLDVIHCGDNYALNFCTIGLGSLSIRNSQNIRTGLEAGGAVSQWLNRRIYASLFYLGNIFACMDPNILRQWYEIELDGKNLSGQYRGILVANGAFFQGENCPAHSALPDDSYLEMVFFHSAGRVRTISRVPFYMRGQYERFPKDFFLKHAQKMRIRSKEYIYIILDDVLFYENDCTVEVLPKAIRFVDASGQGYRGGDSGSI